MTNQKPVLLTDEEIKALIEALDEQIYLYDGSIEQADSTDDIKGELEARQWLNGIKSHLEAYL